MRYLILLFLFSCGMVPDKFIGPEMTDEVHKRLNKSVVRYYLQGHGSCSGAILSHDVIITVYHCVAGYEGQHILINDRLYTIANMYLYTKTISDFGEEDGVVFIGLNESLRGEYTLAKLPTDDSQLYRHYIKCWNADGYGFRKWVDNDAITFHYDMEHFDKPSLYLSKFKDADNGCSGGGIFDANGVLRAVYFGTVYGWVNDSYSVGLIVDKKTLAGARHYIKMLTNIKEERR